MSISVPMPRFTYHPLGETARLVVGAEGAYVQKKVISGAGEGTREKQLRGLEMEFKVYSRLGNIPQTLCLIANSSPRRLFLPYMRWGSVEQFVKARAQDGLPFPLSFAADAAECLWILHSQGIIHGDINPANFLVDDMWRLRVICFSHSVVDGMQANRFNERVWYRFPRPMFERPTVQTDIFALGSLIYFISTGTSPFEGQFHYYVDLFFSKKVFPPLGHLYYGEVIWRCWMGLYTSARHVHFDLNFPHLPRVIVSRPARRPSVRRAKSLDLF